MASECLCTSSGKTYKAKNEFIINGMVFERQLPVCGVKGLTVITLAYSESFRAVNQFNPVQYNFIYPRMVIISINLELRGHNHSYFNDNIACRAVNETNI